MPDGGSADEPPPPPKKHRGDLTLDGDHLRRLELQLDNLDRQLYTVHPPRSRAPLLTPAPEGRRIDGGRGFALEIALPTVAWRKRSRGKNNYWYYEVSKFA